MRLKILEILTCPKCFGELSCSILKENDEGEIINGALECRRCEFNCNITQGIPRFVGGRNYASSFSYQWNCFKFEQLDSFTRKSFSEKRFFSETGWTKEWLDGKWILDAGCGAGRFLDVISKSFCDVVGVDISEAIDAASVTIHGRKNVHLVQASIYELPFRPGAFDGCYSIGVIQHTPDPKKAILSLPKFLKKEGRIAVTIYERKKLTKLNSKYLVRPLVKKLNKRCLLFAIKAIMPFLFLLTEILFRLPILGRLFRFVVPVANYVDEAELSFSQRYRWAILDTFDMLSPEYDYPQTEKDVRNYLSKAGIIEIYRLNNSGLNLIGRKRM